MYKKNIFIYILIILVLFSCSKNKKSNTNVVDNNLLKTGYFIDVATMSEVDMIKYLEDIETIEKPTDMGSISITNLKNIFISTPKVREVDGSDIEAYIEEERDKHAFYREVTEKREAKYTDKIIIDYLSQIVGEKANFENIVDFELTLREGIYHKDFIDTIVNHYPNDMFNFTITYPEDYFLEKYSGKKILHKVVIKKIYEYFTPPFNQSFIASFSDIKAKDENEYREKVKNKIKNKIDYISKKDVMDKLLNYLIENSETNPSSKLLSYEYSKIINDEKKVAEKLNIDFPTFIKRDDISIEQAIINYKEMAGYEAIKDMVIDELSNRYNINVDTEDMKNWFSEVSAVNDYKNITYENYIDKMGYEYVYDNTKKEKTLSHILKNINIDYISGE